MIASFQMSRSVQTCIRGCQDFSFSNTQDILNILTGSLLGNEQNGEQVILREEEQFSDEGLTDGEWKNYQSKSPFGACSAQSMSSQTQFSAQDMEHWIQPVLQYF